MAAGEMDGGSVIEPIAPPRWLTLTVSGATLLAILDLPYGYYQLLRILVTGYAGYIAYFYFQRRPGFYSWASLFVAVLYNPIFVISMSKGFHGLVNALTAGLFLYEMYAGRGMIRDRVEGGHLARGLPSEAPKLETAASPSLSRYISESVRPLLTAVLIVLSGIGIVALTKPELLQPETDEFPSEPLHPMEANRAEWDASPGLVEPVAPVARPSEHSAPAEDDLSDVAAAEVAGTPTALSDWRGNQGKCRLVVQGQTYLDGQCWIRLEADGSFQIMSPDERYFAQLHRSGENASGHWNESPFSTHAHATLGSMTRNGACWQNGEAEICAWST